MPMTTRSALSACLPNAILSFLIMVPRSPDCKQSISSEQMISNNLRVSLSTCSSHYSLTNPALLCLSHDCVARVNAYEYNIQPDCTDFGGAGRLTLQLQYLGGRGAIARSDPPPYHRTWWISMHGRHNNPTPKCAVNGTECYDGWVWVTYLFVATAGPAEQVR